MGALAAVGMAVGVALGVVGGGGNSTPSHGHLTGARATGPAAVVAVSGSDAGSCSAAAPCATFARAYQVVSPGATVQVQGGSYPAQQIPYSVAKPAGSHCDAESGDLSGCVTFKPAPNASVTLASFRSEVPYVQIEDMAITDGLGIGGGPLTRSYTCTDIQAHDDIVRHVTSSGAFGFEGASHSALIDSTFTLGDSWRPDNGVSQFSPCSDGTSTTVNDHILVDGVTMRDLLMTHAANQTGCVSWQCMHLECVHLNQANNTTFRNSQFLNCAGHDVFVESNSAGGGSNGLLFENNIFDKTCSHQAAPCADQGGALMIDCHVADGPINNVTIRFNTFNGFAPAWSSENGCHLGGTQLALGNVGSMTTYACSVYTALGSSYAYNVWDGTSCSNTDHNAPSNYTDPTNYNFHLLARSAAIGRVPASAARPAHDLEGVARPRRWQADSGALQREPATIVPGRSIGFARIGDREDKIVAFYGEARHLQNATWGASTRMRTAVYHVHGGALKIGFDNGVVAAVATTSPYYATTGGLGASGSMPSALVRQAHAPCRNLYRMDSTPTPMYVKASLPAHRITEVVIAKLRDADTC